MMNGSDSVSGNAKKTNSPTKSNDARPPQRSTSSSKTGKESSKSSKTGKERAPSSHQLSSNADDISTMLDNTASRSRSGSSTNRSQVKSSPSQGKQAKARERSSSSSSGSRSRQKRKVKTVMAQIVKQVRRGKRTPNKSSKVTGPPKSKSSSSGKVVKSSRSSSSSRNQGRKKKTSRSLQQLHVLEKSVFRSRLECQHTSTDPMPYHWVQSELSKSKGKSSPSEMERNHSESSLVGKSIIYRDDIDLAKGIKSGTKSESTGSNQMEKSDKESLDPELECLSMDALRDEISHCEANDIFEPGPDD